MRRESSHKLSAMPTPMAMAMCPKQLFWKVLGRRRPLPQTYFFTGPSRIPLNTTVSNHNDGGLAAADFDRIQKLAALWCDTLDFCAVKRAELQDHLDSNF